jgi:sugar/nucleoside kinase (ribokinase family)
MTLLISVDAVTSTTTFLQSQRDTVRMVDGIGGSDTFAAGPIRRFVNGCDLEAALTLAAARAWKQTMLSGLLPVTPASA